MLITTKEKNIFPANIIYLLMSNKQLIFIMSVKYRIAERVFKKLLTIPLFLTVLLLSIKTFLASGARKLSKTNYI